MYMYVGTVTESERCGKGSCGTDKALVTRATRCESHRRAGFQQNETESSPVLSICRSASLWLCLNHHASSHV